MHSLAISPLTFIDEMNFKIGRDFTIDLDISDHGAKRNFFKVTLNDTTETGLVQVEEIHLFTYEKCTSLKISPEIKGSIQIYNTIHLNLNSVDVENLPMLRVFFTSQNNSKGVIWEQWLEGEVYDLIIKPKDKIHNIVSLKRQIRKQLPETSYCNQNVGYYDCIGQR